MKKSYALRNYYLINLISLFFFVLSFYGLSAFILASSPDDIINPKTPFILKIIDEALLAVIIFYLSIFGFFKNFKINPSSFESLFLLVLFVINFYIIFKYLIVDTYSVYHIKNMLYGSIFVVILSIFYRKKLFLILLTRLHLSLFLAISASLIQYFVFPYEMYDSRLGGSFLNPNTMGFVSLFNIILAITLYFFNSKNHRFLLFSIFVSILTIILSKSLSAYIQFIVIATCYVLFQHNKWLLLNVAVAAFGFIIVVGLLYLVDFQFIIEIFDKLHSIFDGTANTSTNRIHNYIAARDSIQTLNDLMFGFTTKDMYLGTDSSLLNLFNSYGLLIIVFYSIILLLILGIVLMVFRKHKSSENWGKIIILNSLFIFSVFFVSLLLQYQLEIIPSYLYILTSIFIILVIREKDLEYE